MKFYFCERCGTRLTEHDIEAGEARNKKLRGVFCTQCADGIMTLEEIPLTDKEAQALVRTERPQRAAQKPPTIGHAGRRSSGITRPERTSRRSSEALGPKLPAHARKSSLPWIAAAGGAALMVVVAVVIIGSGGEKTRQPKVRSSKKSERPRKDEKVAAVLTPPQKTQAAEADAGKTEESQPQQPTSTSPGQSSAQPAADTPSEKKAASPEQKPKTSQPVEPQQLDSTKRSPGPNESASAPDKAAVSKAPSPPVQPEPVVEKKSAQPSEADVREFDKALASFLDPWAGGDLDTSVAKARSLSGRFKEGPFKEAATELGAVVAFQVHRIQEVVKRLPSLKGRDVDFVLGKNRMRGRVTAVDGKKLAVNVQGASFTVGPDRLSEAERKRLLPPPDRPEAHLGVALRLAKDGKDQSVREAMSSCRDRPLAVALAAWLDRRRLERLARDLNRLEAHAEKAFKDEKWQAAAQGYQTLLDHHGKGQEVKRVAEWKRQLGKSLIRARGLRQGLVGRYYHGKSPEASALVAERQDAQVTFRWGKDPPHPAVTRNTYCVVWNGFLIITKAGRYKLWLRRELSGRIKLIGKCTSRPDGQFQVSCTTHLDPGHVPIRIEYEYSRYDSFCNLYWSREGGERKLIPPEAFCHAPGATDE